MFKINWSPETRTNSSVGKHVERGGVLSINNRSVSEKSFFFCAETLTTTLRIKKKKNRKDAREEEEDRIIFAKVFSRVLGRKSRSEMMSFFIHWVHACTHVVFQQRGSGLKKNINFLSSFLSLKRTQTRSSSLNKDIYELNVVHNRIQYVAVVIKKVLLS